METVTFQLIDGGFMTLRVDLISYIEKQPEDASHRFYVGFEFGGSSQVKEITAPAFDKISTCMYQVGAPPSNAL